GSAPSYGQLHNPFRHADPVDSRLPGGPAMSVGTEVVVDRSPRAVRTIPDRVLGIAGALMVALAVVLAIVGGSSDGDQPLTAPPLLALLDPQDGTVVDGPLVVSFDVQAELEQQPGGWGIGGYHIHLQLDGLELMPGPTDIS